MPPRPRPRPNPHTSQNDQDDEQDSLFVRNKGRSLKNLAARAATPSDSDDGPEDTPTLGKPPKHNTKALPGWTHNSDIINLLDDSDSEPENHPDLTPSRRPTGPGGNPLPNHHKPARAKSRSRSLTPPPELTMAQKYVAQQAIRNALKAENILPASVPPIVIDDDDDNNNEPGNDAELDPALRHIAQTVLEQAARRKDHDAIKAQGSTSQPLDVTVRVKWIPPSCEENTRETWSFTINRHDSLKELLVQMSARVRIPIDDLILMRDGKRVFSSVSPDGLGVWDQVVLEGCARTTFDALSLSRHLRSPTPSEPPAESASAEFDRESSLALSEAPAGEGESDKFKLVLRAQGCKQVTLVVRPATPCAKIVRAFLAIVKKEGGGAVVPTSPRKAAKVCLSVDGEKKGGEVLIGDCDLEDGDMVEVVGL